MTVLPSTARPAAPAMGGPILTLLRVLLLAEAVAGLVLAIVLSQVAAGVDPEPETSLRFAAGGAFIFAILAAVASRGVRRRRGWAWTLTALLQVVLAIGTGAAVMAATWHPAYLAGFALAAVVMIVLSAGSVRRGLGQE